MDALNKINRELWDLNRTIEKHTNKLVNLTHERDNFSGSIYSVDEGVRYEEILEKISKAGYTLEQLITKRDELEKRIFKNNKVNTNIKGHTNKTYTIDINHFNHIVNTLTKMSKNKILSYDVLYDAIPPEVVSADLIDEIVTHLKNRDIQVLDNVYKEEEVGQYIGKIDDEITAYERNVELQLNELFKGSYVKRDTDDNISELQAIIDTSTNVPAELGKVDISIPPPHLPQITDVIPRLTTEIDSLLISKYGARVKEKKDISLTSIENIEPTIFSGMPDSDDKDILPYQGKKIYSKARFDNARRLSLYAKTVGDRAEEIVIKFLSETLLPNEKTTIRWISKAGETPGWDISYYSNENQLVAIEVKGTTGNSFPNVEITANEWDAANELRERYWIYLVTGCFGINPQIQQLNNPVRLKEFGVLAVTPLLWKIEMLAQ